MATWNAYQNQYWPAEYLLDQQGRVAYTSFGEGDYAQTDAAVAELLEVRTAALPSSTPVPANTTPELYAGSERRGSSPTTRPTERSAAPLAYPDPGPPQTQNAIQVTGTWTDEGQYLAGGHHRPRPPQLPRPTPCTSSPARPGPLCVFQSNLTERR